MDKERGGWIGMGLDGIGTFNGMDWKLLVNILQRLITQKIAPAVPTRFSSGTCLNCLAVALTATLRFRET